MRLALVKHGSEKQIGPLEFVGNLCDRIAQESLSSKFSGSSSKGGQHSQRETALWLCPGIRTGRHLFRGPAKRTLSQHSEGQLSPTQLHSTRYLRLPESQEAATISRCQ